MNNIKKRNILKRYINLITSEKYRLYRIIKASDFSVDYVGYRVFPVPNEIFDELIEELKLLKNNGIYLG